MTVAVRMVVRWSMLWATLATVGGGCGRAEEEAPEDLTVQKGAVSVYPAATSGSAIQYGQMWTWATNGANKISLLPLANNTCFLTSIWGLFKSDSQHLDELWTSNLGIGTANWVIGGETVLGGSPAGDAFCIKNVTATPTVLAIRGASKVLPNVSPATHSCFLTIIDGGFDGSDSYVRLRASGSEWRLEAGPHNAGAAQCIAKPAGPEFTVSASPSEVQLRAVTKIGPLPPVVVDAINTTSTDPYFCALTGVQGNLRGIDGAWVGAYLKPQADGTRAWKLGKGAYAQSFLFPLTGSARCLR